MSRSFRLMVTAGVMALALAVPVHGASVPRTASQANAPLVAIGDAAYFLARGGPAICEVMKRDAILAHKEMVRIKR